MQDGGAASALREAVHVINDMLKVPSTPESLDLIEARKFACPQHPFPKRKSGYVSFAMTPSGAALALAPL